MEKATQKPIPKGVVRPQTWKNGKSLGIKGTYFDREIYNSQAYRSLSGNTLKVLMGFLMRRIIKKHSRRRNPMKKYEVMNSKELVYTYDAIKYETGISDQTVSRAIRDLVSVGFLDIVNPGGGRCGLVTIYGLSDRYMKWHPDLEERKKRGFVEKERKLAPGHRGFENRAPNLQVHKKAV
jgi:hypothetical protein